MCIRDRLFIDEPSLSFSLASHIDLYYFAHHLHSWFDQNLKTFESSPQKSFLLWHSYLSFVRKTRGTKDGKYISLLSAFTQTFASHPEFKDDPKLVQRFIQYAESTSNPVEVYEYMSEKGIGADCALWYYSYACALEKKHRFEDALNVLLAGTAKKSINKEQLQMWIDEFESRMEQRVNQGQEKRKRGQPRLCDSTEPQESRMYCGGCSIEGGL
eukprot:TRINITY_DN9573_c0_g1_i3.p1 TRINITY_DN9573_c0_g1~~TRINITY_DN9573_c0_g1_i3.p1  ORF type:complete len:214 (-),score=45.91 TRINITY_DN9573_c0_g1_i3:1142-1783(-)